MIERTFFFRVARALTALGCAALLLSCGGGDGSSRGPLPSPGVGPVVTITAPQNLSANLTGGLVIGANAVPGTSNSPVASVEFQVDGVTVDTETTTPIGDATTTIDTADYAAGQHVIRVRATDSAGASSDWTSITVQFGGTRFAPAGFNRNEAFVNNVNAGTAIAQAPDGRLFIAEQGGTLRVVAGGVLQPTPFVTLNVDQQGERGLLGVALHPNFTTNNLVYVYYTATTPTVHNRISRFTANGNVAQPGEDIIFELPTLSSATNHNGGAIHFGPDGKLYVGVGENADGPKAQSQTSVLGKLLRLNEDGSVPNDNPFFSSRAGDARAVWADGLRNPFTFAIQPVTGRIHINDVGQNTWEEINLGAAGANYGWPNSEGPDNVGTGITGPLFAYRQTPSAPPGSGPGGFFVGNAITGGVFYPSSGPFGAPWTGGYFFADFGSRFVGFLDLAAGTAAYTFGTVNGNPVDMIVASDGALLVLTRSNVVRFSRL